MVARQVQSETEPSVAEKFPGYHWHRIPERVTVVFPEKKLVHRSHAVVDLEIRRQFDSEE